MSNPTELALPYQPDSPDANFSYWAKMGEWNYEEAAAVLVGINPNRLSLDEAKFRVSVRHVLLTPPSFSRRSGTLSDIQSLPETGFVRLSAILAPRGPIPVGKSTWWQGVRDGRFPKPVKLGPKTTAWRVADIRELIERLGR
jgi:prophage regulatory protein